MLNVMGRATLAKQMMLAGKDAGEWFLERVRAGEIDPRDHAMLQDGAEQYIKAIAKGDIAPREDVESRLATCAACPNRTPHPTDPHHLGFCGPRFEDHQDDPDPSQRTCGCPVGPHAHVGSAGCSSGRYAAVTIRN